jgi:hypothetical protein
VSQRFEWAHASGGFELVVPDVLDDWAEDGNDAREWGLAFSTGSNGCMVYGSLEDLHGLGVSIVAQTGAMLAARAGQPRLSPGEWAGVMTVLEERAATLRQYASISDTDDLELAVDYRRIAEKVRQALADDGDART